MTWSQKRQTLIISIFLVILFVFLGITVGPKLRHVSTCTNGTRDGNELGVDCGGSCPKLCAFEVSSPAIRFFTFMKVSENFYNVIAYIENQNIDSGIKNIGYEFELFDANNLSIMKKTGKTFLAPGPTAIFEPYIDTGGLVPMRVSFRFTEPFIFSKVAKGSSDVIFSLVDKNLTRLQTSPLLEAILKNNSNYNLSGFEVLALLRDINSNVVVFSKTMVDGM